MPITSLKGLISDEVLSLPAEDVQRSCGLALDIGSTVGKVVYRSNKEYKNGQPIIPQDDASRGRVHYAMFPRADVTGMINYVKENCDLVRDESGELLVKSAGVGGAAFRTKIEAGLNCKMKILQEYDCFSKAFLAVEKTTPAEELFMPLSPENQAVVDTEAEKHRNDFKAMMVKLKGHSEMDMEPMVGAAKEVKEEELPRLLMMSGSGSAVMQLNRDGTFSLIDGVYMGGRYMYGLASILTGENDFDKLTEMAQTSDGKTVDTWLSDLLGDAEEAGSKDNPYEMAREQDKRAFPFGKGVNTPAEKMNKGDLAYSVFNTTAELHAHLIGSCVKISKAREVIVCGNMFRSECMKLLISKVLAHRQVWLNPGFQYRVRFLRNGGMYGALGAYLNRE